MNQALNFLGILNRAKKLRIGEEVFHSRKGGLLILATDVAPAQKKKLLDLASPNIEISRTFTKEQLGSALGYEELSAILLEDKKAAKAYLAKLV